MFGSRKKYDLLSDEALMELSAKGRERAFSALYDRYATILFRYFCRMLKNDKEKAEDFVQDLFAKIAQKPELFDTTRNFKTWLFSAANNMCKNEYRRMAVRSNTSNSLEKGLDVPDGSSTEYERLHDDAVFREALQAALNGLDAKQREAFVMRYEQDLSIREIAEVYACSEGTIKSRLFYTLRKLNKQLQVFNPHSTAT